MERVLLTDVCKFQYGYAFDSKKFSNEGKTPLVRIRDVIRGYSETYTDEDFDDTYLVHDGDMLIGMDGEFNIACWHGGDAALNQRVCKLIPSDKIDSAYIFYRMMRILKQIENKTPFVTVKHLSAKELNAVYIDLPNKNEQELQGKRLIYIDRLIGKYESQIKIMDKFVKSRFVEMFGDFSAYKYDSLKNTTNFIDYRGKTPTLSEQGTIRMINAKSVGKGVFKDVDEYISQETYDAWMKRGFPKPGDVLFVTEGHTFGNVCRIPDDLTKFAMGQRVITIQGNNNIVDNAYLAIYMQSKEFYGEISKHKTGSSAQGIRSKELALVEIPVPPIALQEEFHEFVSLVDKSKLSIQQSIETLQTLKAKLMQDYFG